LQRLLRNYRNASRTGTNPAQVRRATNPFSSCLPLLQSPIFFALFRVLANMAAIAAGTKPAIGRLTPAVAAQANASTIFGAPLSAKPESIEDSPVTETRPESGQRQQPKRQEAGQAVASTAVALGATTVPG